MKDLGELKKDAKTALEETREAREEATAQAEAMRTAIQLMIIILVSAVLLNVLFFFLSGAYYDDRRASQGLMSTITDATVRSTRVSFGIFSGLVTVSLVGAVFAPKWVGHIISGALGLASLVGAVASIRAGMPLALSVSLIVIGLIYPALVVLSLAFQSRAAWAFLSALCWVLGVVMLFGAPKIRNQIDIGLWTAMIIPGMLTVGGIALAMVRREYRDRTRYG